MRFRHSRPGERARRSSTVDAPSSSLRPESAASFATPADPRKRGTGRGTGVSAGCSPSRASSSVGVAVDAVAASRADPSRQLQSALGLGERAHRAALFAARTNSTVPARQSIAVPWREAITRSDRVCDHARGHSRGRSRHAVSVSAGAGDSPRCDRRSPRRRAQSAPCLHRPSDSIVRFAVARSRRSALLRPRIRAAGGLDRAIREPQVRNCRRPRVNLLTTRSDGGIFEFSSTVAIRNPLHIS
jgi:hypothetical protein